MNLRCPRNLALAILLVACAEPPTASRMSLGDPLLVVSDPPPPPADGTENAQTCDPETPCPPPLIQISPLGVKFFLAPRSNTAYVTFTSPDANVVISPNARVRDNGNGLIGTGTITGKARVVPDGPLVPLVVDLSTATGTLLTTERPVRFISFLAEARYAASGEPVGTPVLFSFSFF